jgi:hypothetical protein
VKLIRITVETLAVAAMLGGAFAPGILHEDAVHGFSGHTEEVPPTFSARVGTVAN